MQLIVNSGQLPEGWEKKQLRDICDLQNGYAFKSESYIDNSNTLNIRMSNIRPNGEFDPEHNIKFLPDSFAQDYSQFLLKEGDLVIAMTDMASDSKILGLPTLVSKLNGRNFLLNQRVGKLHSFSNQVDISYLRYFLSSPEIKEYYKKKGTGGLQINISKKDILSATIPIPPLPEQKRIVAILDEAFEGIDSAIANTEKNLTNSREIFESYLNNIFTQKGDGWLEKELGEICDLQNGYAFKSESYIDNSNTLNIRMSNIRPNGEFDPEHNIKFLPDSFAQDYSQFLLKEGDLIIAMTDMAGNPKILGLPTMVNKINGRNFLLNQRVGKLHSFSNQIDVAYLRYFLSSPGIKEYYKSKGAGGLQINISKKDILSATIPVPSFSEQKRIVAILDEVRTETQRLETIYRQKLAALKELKQSILQKAFTGELTADTSKTVKEEIAA